MLGVTELRSYPSLSERESTVLGHVEALIGLIRPDKMRTPIEADHKGNVLDAV
jgi:hypothetical protein